MRAAAATLVAGLLGALPAVAAAQSEPSSLFQCVSHFQAGEETYGIPAGLLYAMSVVESGRGGVPWPWAINRAGQAVFAPTREDALKLMRDDAGAVREDVAIGCMQIYLKWHVQAFPVPEEVLEPSVNVAYAAHYLRALRDRYGSWVEAVRHYHGSDAAAQTAYLCRVLDWRVRLGYQRVTAEMTRLCAGNVS